MKPLQRRERAHSPLMDIFHIISYKIDSRPSKSTKIICIHAQANFFYVSNKTRFDVYSQHARTHFTNSTSFLFKLCFYHVTIFFWFCVKFYSVDVYSIRDDVVDAHSFTTVDQLKTSDTKFRVKYQSADSNVCTNKKKRRAYCCFEPCLFGFLLFEACTSEEDN